MTSACASVGGRIYVLQGTYAPLKPSPNPYYNVADSWLYDGAKNEWSRLRDLPPGANRYAVPYRERYMILIGGYKYPRMWNPDGTQTEVYTPEEKAKDWKEFFEDTVLVYDTRTGRLGTADHLLDRSSLPMVAIHGDTVFALGGEGGARLWHPATFEIGQVTELPGP
jgi:hypothetical protein